MSATDSRGSPGASMLRSPRVLFVALTIFGLLAFRIVYNRQHGQLPSSEQLASPNVLLTSKVGSAGSSLLGIEASPASSADVKNSTLGVSLAMRSLHLDRTLC